MSSSIKKLLPSEIKGHKSKTDSALTNSVAIILIVFLFSVTAILLGADNIRSVLTQPIVIVILSIFVIIGFVILIFYALDAIYLKSVARSSKLNLSIEKNIFEDGSTTLDSYVSSLDNRTNEIDPILKQLDKVQSSMNIDTLLSPDDLIFFNEAREEYIEYDNDVLSYLEKQTILIRYTMSNHSKMDIFFGKLGDNSDDVKRLISSFNSLIDKRISFQGALNAFKTKLSKFIIQFSSWDDLIEVLTQSKPGIQVTLDRIAELCNHGKNEIEIMLKKILEQNSSIGEYYDFEQTFIRLVETSNEIESLKRTKVVKSSMPESLQQCENCKEYQSLLIRLCRNCNSELISCQICKRGFKPSESKINCPECDNIFHPNHFLEVIKISGKCPICAKSIKLDVQT